MATMAITKSGFHPGEQAMRELLRVPRGDNPTQHGLPPRYGYRITTSPLVAFGTLDRQGRPWATIWGGEAGFCMPVAPDVLGVRAVADVRHDPVLRELYAVPRTDDETKREIVDDEVVRPEGGKPLAGLAIDLETRDRVKFAGRMIAGSIARTEPGVGDLQLAVQVEESLGNCPKYLNKKHISPHVPSPRVEFSTEGAGMGMLPQAAVDLIARADLFFIASKHGSTDTMDVNHRGGAPGFLRLLHNHNDQTHPEKGGGAGVSLVYPEYSGNRLYQTLGNLAEDPYAGLVIPDFATGDVVYLTGRASVLVGAKAEAVMPRAKLAVRIDVDEARLVRDGLPFRGEVGEFSPYNPGVRRLAAEQPQQQGLDDAGPGGVATAKLVRRERISPSIARYVFTLGQAASVGRDGDKRLRAWRPGQHVTLDFAGELDAGYSHMRDADPLSLNDDFVRSFTVSRALDPAAVDGAGYVRLAPGVEPEFEITVRRHGPVTRFLERWNLRAPLEVPVLGFGGAEGFRLPVGGGGGVSVFVAAGVGVTPLMAQAPGVLAADGGRGSAALRVLWSLKGEDLPLAVDALKGTPGLGGVTRLFITGSIGRTERELVGVIRELGAEVVERRVEADDMLSAGERGKRTFYCCTGPELMKALLQWTEGEKVLFESFEY
ncbi:hypothetical protein F5B20DRAFT_466593 [Whalleya microplaca]|nr:hypothetical protein F5B20DRAFT_466593 [Whalleya microplaca]